MAKKPVDIAAVLGGQLAAVSELDTSRDQIEYIDIDQIDDDPGNFYALTELDKLASNIQLCGLQQPIRVRSGENGRVTIVSGHRRRAALGLLVEDGLERFRAVPCIRERDEASADLQELRLIFANANTRVLSDYEKTQQVDRVQELLSKLKEQGVEFPGRMRDQVAAACQISASKMARLKVIKEKLRSPFSEQFAADTLSEQAAYALARLPESVQEAVASVEGKHPILGGCAENLLSHHERYYQAEAAQHCPDGQPCSNASGMLKRTARAKYSWQYCQGACCCNCYDAKECAGACAEAKKLAADAKEKSKLESAKAEKKQQAQYAKNREQTQANAAVLLKAIEAAKVGENTKIKIGWQDYSVSEIRRAAQGELGDKIFYSPAMAPTTREDIITICKQLHCSADYLLGLTEDLMQPMRGAVWQRETDYPRKAALVALLDIEQPAPLMRLLHTDYAGNLTFGGSSRNDVGMAPLAWWTVPEIPEDLRILRKEEEGSEEDGVYD